MRNFVRGVVGFVVANAAMWCLIYGCRWLAQHPHELGMAYLAFVVLFVGSIGAFVAIPPKGWPK